MGIKERGSVEPQEEALVHVTPNADERVTPTVAETGAEAGAAEAEAAFTATLAEAAEVLPMPAFFPSAEAPVGAVESAVPAIEVEVLPGVAEEAPVPPLLPGESHAEFKLGLAALALAGFLSFSRGTARTSPKNVFVRGRETD